MCIDCKECDQKSMEELGYCPGCGSEINEMIGIISTEDVTHTCSTGWNPDTLLAEVSA